MSAAVPTGAFPSAGWRGYAPAQPDTQPRVRRTSHLKLFTLLGAGLLAAVLAVVGAAVLATPAVKTVRCPPQCGTPPRGTPQAGLPVFVGAGNSFTVQYYPDKQTWRVSRDSAGVTDTLASGDGSALRVFGLPAHGRTAQQIVSSMIRDAFPNATERYQLPNAMVGYRPGYGEVDKVTPQSSESSYAPESVIVMAAVHNDVALVAEAIGPYQPWDPQNGPWDGHPSGVAMQVAMQLDELVNSFTWNGDRPR